MQNPRQLSQSLGCFARQARCLFLLLGKVILLHLARHLLGLTLTLRSLPRRYPLLLTLPVRAGRPPRSLRHATPIPSTSVPLTVGQLHKTQRDDPRQLTPIGATRYPPSCSTCRSLKRRRGIDRTASSGPRLAEWVQQQRGRAEPCGTACWSQATYSDSCFIRTFLLAFRILHTTL